MMLSSTLMPLNRARFWKVRATPISATWREFMCVKVWPRKRDRAFLRRVDAVDAVQHRALAGAVRPDDRAHLVLAHVEADVGQRLHAAEAQADVLHVEDDLADLSGWPCQAAFFTAAKVFASTIFSVAETMPVRPSSNFTCVSMYCSVLPPYSASTSTW